MIDLKVKKFAQKKTRHLLFLLTGTSAKIIGFLKKKDEKFKVKIVNRIRKPRIIFKKNKQLIYNITQSGPGESYLVPLCTRALS